MATYNKCMTFSTEGSSALAPEPAPKLVLIEGGKRKIPEGASRQGNSPVRSRVNVSLLAYLLAGLLAILVAAIFASVSSTAYSQSRSILAGASSEIVDVRSGDSLWSIASSHSVDGCSTEAVIQWIKASNHLSNSNISAGQQLIVPTM